MAGVAQARQHFFNSKNCDKGLFNVKTEFKYIVSLSFWALELRGNKAPPRNIIILHKHH